MYIERDDKHFLTISSSKEPTTYIMFRYKIWGITRTKIERLFDFIIKTILFPNFDSVRLINSEFVVSLTVTEMIQSLLYI